MKKRRSTWLATANSAASRTAHGNAVRVARNAHQESGGDERGLHVLIGRNRCHKPYFAAACVPLH